MMFMAKASIRSASPRVPNSPAMRAIEREDLNRLRLDIDGDGFKPVAHTIFLLLASPSVQCPVQ